MEVNRGAFVGAIVLVVAVNIVLIALVVGSANGSGQLMAGSGVCVGGCTVRTVAASKETSSSVFISPL